MPFFATRPNSMTIAISENRLSVWWRTASPRERPNERDRDREHHDERLDERAVEHDHQHVDEHERRRERERHARERLVEEVGVARGHGLDAVGQEAGLAQLLLDRAEDRAQRDVGVRIDVGS
jgi:hypothetical protein